MTVSSTSDLLADSVIQCVADMKLNLLSEVDRLAELLQRDLIDQLSVSGYDGMPGMDKLQGESASEPRSDVTPRQTELTPGGGQGAEDEGAREDRALLRGSSQGFTNVDSEASGNSITTPIFLEVKEREIERQKSAEKATSYGIPALPLESLHGNAKSDHTPENGNAAIQPDQPTDSTQKPFLEAEASTLVVSEALDPVGDGHDQADEELSQAEEVNVSQTTRRSSRLWLPAPIRASLSADSSASVFGKHPMVRRIVRSRVFETFFSIIIVLNCVTMGLEAEQTVKGPANDGTYYFLLTAEHSFTALFSIELVMRYLVYGWRAYIPDSGENWWNFMDAFLVIFTGVLFSWVLPVLSELFDFNSDSSMMRTLTTLRAARLLRLVRVVQRVPQFREAWLLLRGLTDSMRTLFWTCAVIMFITYIFAVFGMVLITKQLWERRDTSNDPALVQELSELLEYVGGLDLLMYTLIQLLTMDSWNAIVRRLVKQMSWCWAYFYAYIAVAVFVLMNLVTAIIVENAVTNSRQDEDQLIKQREKAKLEELKGLEHLFALMDSDGSGTLSWEEFKDAFDDPEMTRKWKLLDFDPDECKELFGLLDDGDGEIETHEFFEGLRQMKGLAQSKDLFRLRKCMDEVKEKVESLKEDEAGDGESKSGGKSPAKVKTPRKETTPGKESPRKETPRQETPRNEAAPYKDLDKVQAKSDAEEARVQSKTPQRALTKGNIRAPTPPAEAEMPIVVPTHALPANPGEKLKLTM